MEPQFPDRSVSLPGGILPGKEYDFLMPILLSIQSVIDK